MPLSEEDVKGLLDRNEKLKSIRAMYEALWNEISMFIFPRRVESSPGQKKTDEIYDSTAIHANELLGASMQGTLTPSSSKWFSLKLRDERLNDIKEVMDWLEMCANRMYLAFHQSNFNSEIKEVYLDLGAYGTGCLLSEEKRITRPGFNGMQFRAIENTSYCTAENSEGVVDTIFIEFELSARAAIAKWGETAVGEKVVAFKDREPDKLFAFLHCVYPDEEKGGKPWISHRIAVDSKKHVAENGYYEFPAQVPRWSIASGEDYGTGPGHTALPDVKTLNKAKEFGLKAWAKDLDPETYETDGGVIGSLQRVPGGRNVVRNKDSIWHLDHGVRYDVSQIKEEEIRQSIRQIFYSDQLKLQEGPEMTATEVQVRYELMQRLLGPTIGRLETELLNPLIERVFGAMMRASSSRYEVLPPPPPILAEMGIDEIDIEYEGPLAKAQRSSELVGMQRLVQFGGELAQIKPEIFDNLDGDAAFRDAAEVAGVPSKNLLSVEEVAAIREERARRQAEEQRKQDAERIAAGLKDIAPVVKEAGERG